MNKYSNTLFTALCSAMLLVFFVPVSVIAADSDSYRLYDDISNVVDPTPLGSTSFSLNEGGQTWVAQPLSGSNFQIVTAPPAAVSSSSSSSEETSSSSEEGATGGSGGGGHRGSRTNEGGSSLKPSAPKDPIFPDLPGQISDKPDVFVEDTVSDPDIGINGFTTPTDSTTDVRRERRTLKPHYFDTTDEQKDQCDCSDTHPSATVVKKVFIPVPTVFQGPIASLIMLIIAFGLGYASKTFRPGHVQVASKKPKPRKTR